MSRFLIVAFVVLASCSKSEEPARSAQPTAAPHAPALPATAKTVKDPAKAREMISAGAVVVDVRTPDEYADGHLPTATNVPVQEFAQRIAEVDKLVGGDKTKPVVVYCAAGARAARAKQQLDAAGYTNVVNGGGYDDLR